MKVRRYVPGQDFNQIASWGAEYGAKYREELFPQTGFIVDGVAAYFLYTTDSSVCWLENLIAKRGVAPEVRDKAIGMLIDEALGCAIEMGFEVAYATTDIMSVAKRAKSFGAGVKAGQVLITKDLTKHSH